MYKATLLHQEVSVSPFTLGINHRGFHQTKKNHKYLKPLYFKNSFVVYYGHRIDWYGDMENFKDMARKIIKDAKKDASYSVRLLDDVNKLAIKIYKEGQKIEQQNLSEFSNKQLADSLNKLYQLGKDISDLGMVAVIPDLRHTILTTLLKDIVKEKIQKYKLKKGINYYFTPLITPTQRGLVHQEKLAVLRMVKEINQNNKLKQLFIKEPLSKLNQKLKNQYPAVYQEINKVYHSYKWLSFGQLGPAKTFNQYLEDIKVYLKTKKYNEEYKSLIEESAKLKKLHVNYAKELKLNPAEKRLFKTTRDFSYNKTCRFDSLLFDFYVLDLLLQEIGKRVNLTVRDLRFASTEEITQLLKGKKVISKLGIEKRRKLCVTVIKGKGLRFLVGEKAKRYIKDKVGDVEVKEDKTLIHGMSVFLGKVSGIARIVNSPKDIYKVKLGDILVSVQTNPDLLPAMKKAAAFVTDIGGITSHAAIVARELKKPCVVGLKIATKIIKDGDQIEVDAIKGDVKKI